jgi:hypothetical protein
LIFKAVDKPRKICHITVALQTLHIYNCIAEIYYNYFNIAKARRERTREAEERERVCAWMEDRDQWSDEEAWDVSERGGRRAESARNQERTSEREYAVDA